MSSHFDLQFNVYESANSWYQTVAAIDVDEYYRKRVLKFSNVPFVSKFASGIYDPKIFDVLKPSKAARFAGIDGWIRMMWRGSELPRWVREAIAVSVSTANDCEY